MKQNPAEAIRYLAQAYGFDLAQLAPQQSAAPASPDDPYSGLTQRLQMIETFLAHDQQRLQAEQLRGVESRVDSFLADPKYKYASDVVQDMLPFLAADPAKNLEAAYAKAIWANPQVREAMLVEETAKKAAAARKAPANVRSNGAHPAPAPEADLDAQIKASWRQMQEQR
jgi:hypothetical protein